MASSVIHLAIAAGLSDKVEDFSRFSLGEVIPDAGVGGHREAHFPVLLCGGTKKTLGLSLFRAQFAKEMLADELYLGYYLHLVQDVIHRRFLYADHRYDPKAPGYLDTLYADYHLLNPYLIHKHGLTIPDVPDTLDAVSLTAAFEFDLPPLRGRIASFFADSADSDGTLFTRAVADDLIKTSVGICRCEIDAVRNGGTVIDENDYAWERKK